MSSAARRDWQVGRRGGSTGVQDVADIADPEQRARALGVLLSNAAMRSSDQELGRRAFELLLFTPNALDYLAKLPVALLWRLFANGELEIAARGSTDPSAVTPLRGAVRSRPICMLRLSRAV